MANVCKLNVTVKNITVHSNGLPPVPLTAGEIKNLSNAITATILWPSSDQSAVVGAVAPVLVNQNNTDISFDFDLTNPDGVHPPDPAHPAARLYRYLDLDDTDGTGSPLYIDVTETVKASWLTKIFADVLKGAVGGAAGLVPGGQVVSAVMSGLSSGIGDWISKLSNDSVSIIGSASMQLHAAQLLAAGKNDYPLKLISGPKAISRDWFIPGKFDAEGNPVEAGDTVLIPANTEIGTITLVIEAFPTS